MSAVTVSRLESWQVDDLAGCARELAAAAGRWRQVNGAVRRLVEDVDAASWNGTSAVAARSAGDDLVRELGQAADSVSFASTVVGRAAEAVRSAQELLTGAQELASSHGLHVLDDDRVLPPPDEILPADWPAWRYERAAERREAAADAATAASTLAREALAAADDADQSAARALMQAEFQPRLGERVGAGWLGLFAHGLPDALVAVLRAALLAGVGARDVPPPGSDPAEVAAWWASLPDSAQRMLLERFPAQIGNLDGVPFAVRDQANRAVLAAEITRIEAEMRVLEENPESVQWPHPDGDMHAVGRYHRLADQLEMLRGAEAALGDSRSRPPRSLILLDVEMPGRAAVALGDLDSAEYVSVMVPGMGSNVAGSMARYTTAARHLYDEQHRWAGRFDSDSTFATVAWLGYHAPQHVDVATGGKATAGAEHLQGTLRGIQAATTEGGSRHVTLIGHSYGSLVAGKSLTDPGEPVGVDTAVFVGSPGVGVDHVDDLDVSQVFVGEAAGDHVADFGRFRRDPSDRGFGAEIISVSGGEDPITGRELTESRGHSEYYDAGTESLRNIALIGLGHPESVTTGGPGGSATGAVKPMIPLITIPNEIIRRLP
jgi:hypothetical protein